MSDNQADLEAKEVDDALRRERMAGLWKENGKYVYALAAFIILIVAGREVYTVQAESARKAQSEIYDAAQVKQADSIGDLQAAVDAWDGAASDLEGDYKSLATLRLGAAKLAAGDIEGAIATYDDLSRRGSTSDVVRDIARLTAAITVADELGDYEGALSRLDLVDGADRPMRFSALEQKGLVLMKLGKLSEARAIFENLSFDPAVPQGIKTRVTTLRDAIPFDVTAPAPVEPATDDPETDNPEADNPAPDNPAPDKAGETQQDSDTPDLRG